jgi:hypothetical protein
MKNKTELQCGEWKLRNYVPVIREAKKPVWPDVEPYVYVPPTGLRREEINLGSLSGGPPIQSLANPDPPKAKRPRRTTAELEAAGVKRRTGKRKPRK